MDARSKMNTKFYLQISMVRYHLVDLSVEGRITLHQILQKWVLEV
jgi:hypothetical protein